MLCLVGGPAWHCLLARVAGGARLEPPTSSSSLLKMPADRHMADCGLPVHVPVSPAPILVTLLEHAYPVL